MIDLGEVLEKYPQNVSSHAQLASLLHDLYPTEKRLTNILLIIFDSGIAARISNLKSLDLIQTHFFTKQLVDAYGLQEQFALEGIDIWANAYGLKILNTPIASHQEFATSRERKYTDKSDYYLENEFFDNSISSGTKENEPLEKSFVCPNTGYELTPAHSGEGFIISKFKGTANRDYIVPNLIEGKTIIGIGAYAYYKCQEIRSLTVSDGIRFIEIGAFAECSNLTDVALPETLFQIGSSNRSRNYSSYATIPQGAFENCGIQRISLPSGLNSIGYSTFKSCRSLCEICLPNEIEKIEVYTFHQCVNLTKVTLPSRLREIGPNAFSECKSLIDIHFPKTLELINSRAFESCSALTDIVFNEGLTVLGISAFINCTSLKHAVIPKTVRVFGGNSDVFAVKTEILLENKPHILLSKNNNLVIFCDIGSEASRYALKMGYKIQQLSQYQSNLLYKLLANLNKLLTHRRFEK